MQVGIDEAGRGCVIGPLVIAAVKDNPFLLKLKLKDSKLLSPSQRNALLKEIKKTSKVKVIKITAKKLNSLMNKYSLNQIERMYMAQLINKFLKEENIERVYIDCPDNNINKFIREIKKDLIKKDIKIIAEHKADINYPIVSAASIVAKVVRDREVEKIKRIIGYDFNSGYSSDPKTREFLKKHFKDKKVEPFIRKKWSTYRRLVESDDQKQSKITQY